MSKAYGEALGSYYHDRYGLEVVCLRIGWCSGADDEAAQRAQAQRMIAAGQGAIYSARQHLSIWLHPRDFTQLVQCSLEADCGFGVFYGASANTPSGSISPRRAGRWVIILSIIYRISPPWTS